MSTTSLSGTVRDESRRPDRHGQKLGGEHFQRILLGLDFSPSSDALFEEALKIAKLRKAELLLAHADPLPNSVCFMPCRNFEEWQSNCRTNARTQCQRYQNQARSQGVRCHLLALDGFPDDAITVVAQKLKVDLIVIGTHRRRIRIFGGLAARIISRANCPVLTVPCGEPTG